MQLQDDGTAHVVETPQSTMFVLYNSGQGDNTQHVGYLYAVYAVAKVTIYSAMTSCVLQGCMWLHLQVGHTYNSRVDVRSAECACGKATLPVRTIFIHACSLYESLVQIISYIVYYILYHLSYIHSSKIWQVPKMH